VIGRSFRSIIRPHSQGISHSHAYFHPLSRLFVASRHWVSPTIINSGLSSLWDTKAAWIGSICLDPQCLSLRCDESYSLDQYVISGASECLHLERYRVFANRERLTVGALTWHQSPFLCAIPPLNPQTLAAYMQNVSAVSRALGQTCVLS